MYAGHGSNAPVLIARKGVAAPGCGAATFSTFLGETGHPGLFGDSTLLRATIAGAGVTALNNEGLWSTRSVNGGAYTLALVVRKGITAVPGVSAGLFTALSKYWGITNNCVLFQATIKGTGITAANDTGLWLAQEDGTIIAVLREGDASPDLADPAKIGVLQAVEVEPLNGHYAVLVSLIGGSVGKDQLLLTGTLNTANATTKQALRLPAARLRKGIAYQATLGTTTSILSMTLPTTSVDASGAGGTGSARAINSAGKLVMKVMFNDKSTHVVTLDP